MPPRSFGQAIRDRRLHLGMSQQELARRLGSDVRVADVARLEALGTAKDIAPLIDRVRQQLQEAATTMWVLEALVDAQEASAKESGS